MGKTIRRLRSSRNWSANELAKRCRVSHTTVQRWESQPFICVNVGNFEALLRALEIDDADLVRLSLARWGESDSAIDRLRIIEAAERFDGPRLERLYQRVLELTPPPSDLPLPSDQTHDPGAIRDPSLWPHGASPSTPPPASRKGGTGAA